MEFRLLLLLAGRAGEVLSRTLIAGFVIVIVALR